jgi:hypothetical protein
MGNPITTAIREVSVMHRRTFLKTSVLGAAALITGVLDNQRTDVAYEDFHGHKLDRELLDLLRAN